MRSVEGSRSERLTVLRGRPGSPQSETTAVAGIAQTMAVANLKSLQSLVECVNVACRLTALISVAVFCAVAAGCGQSSGDSGSESAALTSGQSLVPPPTARPVGITDGTAAERALLHSIVAGMPPSQIRRLRIFAAPAIWRPVLSGDVEVFATYALPKPGSENLRGDWEAHVIGGAFRDRSAALGLPRVLVVGGPHGATRVSPSTARPPAMLPDGAERVRSRVIRRLEGAGFDVAWAQVATPGVSRAMASPSPVFQYRQSTAPAEIA